MIHVAATLRVRPDQQRAAMELANTMQSETRKEAGCIEYTFWRSMDDDGTFFVYERWETPEALQAHFQTAHMASFQAGMADLLESPIDVQVFEIAPVDVDLG